MAIGNGLMDRHRQLRMIGGSQAILEIVISVHSLEVMDSKASHTVHQTANGIYVNDVSIL